MIEIIEHHYAGGHGLDNCKAGVLDQLIRAGHRALLAAKGDGR